MSDENSIIDLDALVPASAKIKFGEKIIEIKPPSVVDVMTLGKLGQKLQGEIEAPVEELEQHVTELTGHIYKLVPELGNQPLNTAQLLRLVQIISDMTMPPDATELKKRGIEPDSPKAP